MTMEIWVARDRRCGADPPKQSECIGGISSERNGESARQASWIEAWQTTMKRSLSAWTHFYIA